MRVIAGTCKGRTLLGPKTEAIRPVLDQVKEALFNILYNVEGLTVLDLFAGTGSVGIEALSRGARHCTFVDSSKESIPIIRRNLENCGFLAQATVLPISAGKAIAQLEDRALPFDLIFCDPPYQERWVKKTLQKLENSLLVAPNTLIIVEHHPKEPIPELSGLVLTDSRKYGQTLVSFLKKSS